MADPNGILAEYSPRFSGLTLSEATADLINGTEKDKLPFHYSFALWIITDALSKERPSKPNIPYPFIDLYDLNEALEDHTSYTQLLSVFEPLNNQGKNKFPYQLKAWGDVPGFSYISKFDAKKLSSEVTSLKSDIESGGKGGNSWIDDIEEPDDILQILSWLNEAEEKTKIFCW